MGCGGSQDVKVQITDPINREMSLTHIVELDQNFHVLSDLLKEAETIRQSIVIARTNMLKISKASLLQAPLTPDLATAYRLWTNGVSCCNKGSLSENNVLLTITREGFTYDLGICGELRFIWFANLLQNYIWGIGQGNNRLPTIKKSISNLLRKLEKQKSEISSLTKNLSSEEKNQIENYMDKNLSSSNQGLEIIKELDKNVELFDTELNNLINEQEAIHAEADIIGSQLYQAYGLVPLDKLDQSTPDKFRMKTKMNNIIYYYPGLKNPDEDLKDDIKEDRRIETKIKHGSNNKIYKDFLTELRWCGIKSLDQPLIKITIALQDLNEQKNHLKQIFFTIRYKLKTYQLKNDSIIEAWRVFCWVLASTQKGGDITNLRVLDEPPYCIGLEQIKIKDHIINEIRNLFLQYFALSCPSKAHVLNAEWQYFMNCEQEIETLMRGDFFYWDDFKQIDFQKQLFSRFYIILRFANLNKIAKNLYDVLYYRKVSQQIYDKRYIKYAIQAEEFWNSAQKIIDEEGKSKKASGIPLWNIVDMVHEGEQLSGDELIRKEEKLKKYLETKNLNKKS